MSNIEVWVHDCPNSGKREAMPTSKHCVGCGAKPAEWDASQGANPDTCLHILSKLVEPEPVLWICVSCNSTLSGAYMSEFVWDYEVESDLFKRRSIRDTRRARAEEPNGPGFVNGSWEPYERLKRELLGSVPNSLVIEVIVDDWPRVIKFENKYFEEEHLIEYGVDRWTEIYPGRTLDQYLRSRGVERPQTRASSDD